MMVWQARSAGVLLSSIVLIGGVGYSLMRRVTRANTFDISVDPFLSDQCTAEINNLIMTNSAASVRWVTKKLLENCTALDAICVSQQPDATRVVAVTAHIPRIYIAGFILLANGALCPAAYYGAKVVETLPQIEMPASHAISDGFKKWLLNLPVEVFKNYTIIWIDDYEIQLVEKINSHTKIVCSIENSLDDAAQKMYERIITQKRAMLPGIQQLHVSIDVRFEKQIVLSTRKGGGFNG